MQSSKSSAGRASAVRLGPAYTIAAVAKTSTRSSPPCSAGDCQLFRLSSPVVSPGSWTVPPSRLSSTPLVRSGFGGSVGPFPNRYLVQPRLGAGFGLTMNRPTLAVDHMHRGLRPAEISRQREGSPSKPARARRNPHLGRLPGMRYRCHRGTPFSVCTAAQTRCSGRSTGFAVYSAGARSSAACKGPLPPEAPHRPVHVDLILTAAGLCSKVAAMTPVSDTGI